VTRQSGVWNFSKVVAEGLPCFNVFYHEVQVFGQISLRWFDVDGWIILVKFLVEALCLGI